VKFNQNANTLPHANKKFVVTPNRLILYNLKQKKSKTFIPTILLEDMCIKSPTLDIESTQQSSLNIEGHKKVPIKMESLSVPNHKPTPVFQNILHFLSHKKIPFENLGLVKFWALKKIIFICAQCF